MSFTLFWPLFLPSYSLPSVNGHSTLLTIATEFAAKARGAAMSLVAFCFMGGGGIGTALGGRLIKAVGFEQFFSYYGLALLIFSRGRQRLRNM